MYIHCRSQDRYDEQPNRRMLMARNLTGCIREVMTRDGLELGGTRCTSHPRRRMQLPSTLTTGNVLIGRCTMYKYPMCMVVLKLGREMESVGAIRCRPTDRLYKKQDVCDILQVKE